MVCFNMAVHCHSEKERLTELQGIIEQRDSALLSAWFDVKAGLSFLWKWIFMIAISLALTSVSKDATSPPKAKIELFVISLRGEFIYWLFCDYKHT